MSKYDIKNNKLNKIVTYSVLHICWVSPSLTPSETLLCPAGILGTHSRNMQCGMRTETSGLKTISAAFCTAFHFVFFILLNT